jgi:AraC family transcriptional regulator
MSDPEAMRIVPLRTGAGGSNGGQRSGFAAGLYRIPAGLIDVAPALDHVVGIHVGPPVREACRIDGRVHRRLQTEGDIDILPAGLSGVWEDETAGTVLLLRMTQAFWREAADGMGVDPEQAQLDPRFQLKDPRIEHIGWALKAELEADEPGGPLYTESLGNALAVHLLRRYAGAATIRPRRGLSAVQRRRVLDHIEGHLDDRMSLSELAAVAGISVSHFKSLFKATTGLSVHRYVMERRVERAKTLLLGGALPMSAIALEAGFAHQSHMARAMRRILGVTPSAVLQSRT